MSHKTRKTWYLAILATFLQTPEPNFVAWCQLSLKLTAMLLRSDFHFASSMSTLFCRRLNTKQNKNWLLSKFKHSYRLIKPIIKPISLHIKRGIFEFDCTKWMDQSLFIWSQQTTRSSFQRRMITSTFSLRIKITCVVLTMCYTCKRLLSINLCAWRHLLANLTACSSTSCRWLLSQSRLKIRLRPYWKQTLISLFKRLI